LLDWLNEFGKPYPQHVPDHPDGAGVIDRNLER
jgi:hypothetical protein